MTGWVKRRMAQVLTRPAVAPPVEEPEPARSSFAEKILRWRAVFAAQRQAQPTVDAVEAAREQVRRQRTEAMENEIAKSIAFKGYHWPGEPFDDVVPTQAPGGLRMFGLEMWAAQADDMDWQARVDEAQRQDIANGGRG